MLVTCPYPMFAAMSVGRPAVDAAYGASGIAATAGRGLVAPTGAEGRDTELSVSVAVMMASRYRAPARSPGRNGCRRAAFPALQVAMDAAGQRSSFSRSQWMPERAR